jgi:hypothetical protein
MKPVILNFAFSIIVTASVVAQADTKSYSCKSGSGPFAGYSVIITAENDSIAKSQGQASFNGDDVTCTVLPRRGGIADLGGKKWGFQGLAKNETYLEFADGQVRWVQDCGSEKMIQKFNTEMVGTNKLKLSPAGIEGSCNPHYVAGFKDGSIVTFSVLIRDGQASTMVVEDNRPNEDMAYQSLYQEMK